MDCSSRHKLVESRLSLLEGLLRLRPHAQGNSPCDRPQKPSRAPVFQLVEFERYTRI